MFTINRILIFFIFILFCVPFVFLFEFGITEIFNSIEKLFSINYLNLITNTILLVISVTVTSSVIGLFLSWATEMCHLKYKKIWRILLIIPLVIPSYFAGYIFILFFGPKGELFDFINSLGISTNIPNLYGFWGAWICLSSLCYPYAYLNLSAGLKSVDRKLEDASRVLGYNHLQTFYKIILPNIKTSFFTGGVLIALYTLSDFGAVSALQYNTFTLAIYTKFRSFDLNGAAASSIILVLISIPIIYYAINMSIINSYRISQRPSNLSNIKLFDLKKYEPLVQLILFFTVLISFIIPFAMIFTLISRTNLGIYETFSVIKYSSIYNTIMGSTITGILCVAICLLVILNLSKRNKILRYFFESVMHFGFTLPGIVIALSFVYFSINYMFPIYQTWIILIFGYTVLFLSTAYGPIMRSVNLIGERYINASKSLGKGSFDTLINVSIPLYRPGIIKGFLNVFILTAKELPVTLILAPLNFNTLSTVIWDNLEEANFSTAGIAGLLLIIIITIPTYLSIHIDDIKIKFINIKK